MPRAASNLRVFVDFKEHTVFAGEDIECTITLKNIDPVSNTPITATSSSATLTQNDQNGTPHPVDPLDHLKAARVPSLASLPAHPPQRRPIHNRNLSSLSVVESASETPTADNPTAGVHIANAGPKAKHARRVSIVSLSNSPTTSQRPNLRHARSASVQSSQPSLSLQTTSPSNQPQDFAGPTNTRINQSSQSTSPLSPSPPSETSTPPLMRPSHPKIATRQSSGHHSHQKTELSPGNESQRTPTPTSWTFPSGSQLKKEPMSKSRPPIQVQPISSQPRPSQSHLSKTPSPNPDESQPSANSNRPKALPKTFSVKSLEDTPRSSMDIYSHSNHSNETLASDYPVTTQPTTRLLQLPQLNRASSQFSRQPRITRTVETLMMGYVQLTGSFSLDGSLVNQSPFEEVKRRAVVGGQGGGGVVGLSRASGEGGLFSSLNWSSIGESFGGLIGGSNLSSIKEMKSIADSSSIPLLSTSKSILFVDIKLQPGQSKSYSYRFKLPRGLPPSHRGRAMKVVYNLIIGVQRPNNHKGQQQIKQVEVPFRVFSGVNSQGEFLGHDLMSPYIILKDQAQTAALESPSTPTTPTSQKELALADDPTSSELDFDSYVEQLLTRPRHQSNPGLLSPTVGATEAPVTPRSYSISSFRSQINLSARELIDQTIRQCSNPSSPLHLPTNFQIARASVPIASVTLSRSAVRLGDLVTCIIDFSSAKLPCYAFEATLESSEKVDPALAIRSPQSVERATRKVWARSIENALWANRCSFRAQVPVTATPGFTTTGVGLDWSIRLELVVAISDRPPQASLATQEDDEPKHQAAHTWATQTKPEQLLEVINIDDRAAVLMAKHRLPCESFEVTLPIRVFGASSNCEEADFEDAQGLLI